METTYTRKLSARPSIHGNKCKESSINKNFTKKPAKLDQDEVDNVMSKIDHQHMIFEERPSNSFTRQKQDSDEDDDSFSELLNGTTESQYDKEKKTNKSASKCDHFFMEDTSTQHKSIASYLNSTLIVIFITVLALLYTYVIPYINNNDSMYDDSSFFRDIHNIKNSYNINRDSILKIKTGISTIYTKRDTGAFIFVYNSVSENFDETKLLKIINEIAFASARFLRNHSSQIKHIWVDSVKLNMKNHTELINTYREPITRGGVMVVKDMEEIPSNVAMGFHYFCDEYNPLVRRSAIFFTLDISKCSNNKDVRSYHTIVEKCLTVKWTSIPVEKVYPLMSRIVSVIIDFTNIFDQ